MDCWVCRPYHLSGWPTEPLVAKCGPVVNVNTDSRIQIVLVFLYNRIPFLPSVYVCFQYLLFYCKLVDPGPDLGSERGGASLVYISQQNNIVISSHWDTIGDTVLLQRALFIYCYIYIYSYYYIEIENKLLRLHTSSISEFHVVLSY